MGLLKPLIVINAIFMLSACSSSSDVASNDYELRGYYSAFEGNKLTIDKSIPEDKLSLYQAGYKRGLIDFCNQNGYEVGLSGVSYDNTCEELNPLFMSQYRTGVNESQNEDWDSSDDMGGALATAIYEYYQQEQ